MTPRAPGGAILLRGWTEIENHKFDEFGFLTRWRIRRLGKLGIFEVGFASGAVFVNPSEIKEGLRRLESARDRAADASPGRRGRIPDAEALGGTGGEK